MLLRSLICCLTIGACSDSTPGIDENKSVPLSVSQQIIEARGIRATEAVSPAKHFRMTGEIVFHKFDDATQSAELWLGGAQRMRFAIGGNGPKNIILLDGNNGCWNKTPSTEFSDYPAFKQSLATETELRWYIMRMPWDNHDQRFSFELNTDGLPSKVMLGDTSVLLSEYKPLGKKDTLYPTVWRWESPGDERTEIYEVLQDGALFLDSAFVPPKFNPLDSLQLAQSSAESLADRVGLVTEDFYYVAEDDFLGESHMPKGWWWTSDRKRYFVFDQKPEFQIANLMAVTGKTWMRWATYNDVLDSIGSNQLLNIVEQTGYKKTGLVWSKEIKNRSRKRLKVFLVPVEEK
ncbi:MAG: hypothetical protein H8E25_04985 [Planctomycetes bacterium]|nr:hypothetical protein [Planctomycetota bacterium]